MIVHGTLLVLLASLSIVHSVQQKLQLSDSFLPVVMQVVSHLTDQMAFETKDDITPATNPPTTPRPYASFMEYGDASGNFDFDPFYGLQSFWGGMSGGWWMRYGLRMDPTTPFHKPGLYAPLTPPKPSERVNRLHQKNFLLPMYNSQYTVISPQETKTDEPFLSIHHEEVKPLIEPSPDSMKLLPPFESKIKSRSDGFVVDDDDFSEENLQYLSDDVREMIKTARDPVDEKVVDVWSDVRAGPQTGAAKAKLSSSNLRLLLLYDLLSRDAKRQKLSDYSGFSPEVMNVLVDSASGGARAQLRLVLAKMVERKDCGHDYANNRAREMVEELAKDESKLSSELRYLQPLVYMN